MPRSSVTLFAALAVFAQPCFGAQILLRSQQPPPITGVQTFTGNHEVRISPVESPNSLTVLVLVDSCAPDTTDSVISGISTVWTALHQSKTVRIGILQNGAIQFAGPFETRAKLQAALKELKTVLAVERPAVDPAAWMNELLAAVPQLGGNWAAVVLVGDLPKLDTTAAEYAAAVLFRAFVTQKLSVSWLGTAGADADIWQPLFTGTGGMVLSELSEVGTLLNDHSWLYFELSWDTAPLKAGFVLGRAALSGGATLPTFPDLILGANGPVPTLAEWSELRQLATAATRLAAQSTFSPEDIAQTHSTLQRALTINPRDSETLRAGASIYAKAKDFKTAAALLSNWLEVNPANPKTLDEMGVDLFQDKQYEIAEQALLRARDSGLKTPPGAECLARIHLERKDDAGALPFFAELLSAQPNRADVWFLQGDSAQRANRRDLQVESWEHGLTLDAGNLRYRTQLVNAYFEANRRDDCLRHIHIVLAAPPADASVRKTYAEFLDRLEVSTEALAAWKSVLQIDAKDETALYRAGRLSLEAKDSAAAIEAAGAGIDAHPESARLYILKSEALQAKGEVYQARAALDTGKTKVKDIDLYRKAAEDEDGFGGDAALAFREFAELLAAGTAAPPDLEHILERGLEVSVRENNKDQTQWFAERLRAAGRDSFAKHYMQSANAAVSTIMLPGGMDALAFIAGSREHTSPERFFGDYCQTVANNTGGAEPKAAHLYVENIENYFQKLAELEALGTRDKNGSIVILTLKDKRGRQNTEKVLGLLGMRLRSSHGDVSIEEVTKGARRQDLAGALAVDSGSIAKSLSQGKEYRIDIPYDPVPVWPEEKLWRETFFEKEKMYGGLAQAVVRWPRLARLYRALSVLDKHTLDALLQASSLKVLYDKHVDLLVRHSAALSVQQGHAVVPGGDAAEPIWTRLAGVSPIQAPAFFRALLDKDDGRLLAFFFTLSQLDPAHQRFFTLNAPRAALFYQLYGESAQGQKTSAVTRDTSFSDFLRDVPLDNEGHVDFPGSPEVWLVAKGSSSSETKTAKMLKKVSRTAAPDQEDAVLARLANTRYRQKAQSLTEIDNFLAVSRIDAHRSQPLDEETALLLAQHYSAWSSVYPYFTTLTGVNAAQLRSFFAALDKMSAQKNAAVNPIAGEFHALIELLCLLQRRGELTEEQAATLLGGVSEKFTAAPNPSAIASAAAESLNGILGHCRSTPSDPNPDHRFRVVLLGEPHPVQAGFGERSVTLDPIALRYHDFDRVLEMQKAPPLAPLLAIGGIAVGMQRAGVPTAAQIQELEKAIAAIPVLTLGKEVKVTGREKEILRLYDTAGLVKLSAQVSQKASKKKPNAKDFEKLGDDLLAELQPQFSLALSSLIYGVYLRPVDLPVSEDAFLLRKHRFEDIDLGASAPLNVASFFWVASDGGGSAFTGGFAAFASAAGQAAAVGMKAGKGVPNAVIAAQIAALRDTDWMRLQDSDQRLFNLRVQLGREWIMQSAAHTEALGALSLQTAGLLSPARRSDLLSAVASRSWPRVWGSVTVSDLYSLGNLCAAACDAGVLQSPVAALLRTAAGRNDSHNIDLLGPVASALSLCSHPHLLPAAPYEEYERHLFPTDIAERSAEFKMQLALAADEAGISPGALGAVAEPLLREVLSNTEMSGAYDWRSLLRSCSSVDAKRLWEKMGSQ